MASFTLGLYLALCLVCTVSAAGHYNYTCDAMGLSDCQSQHNQTSLPAAPTPQQCDDAHSYIHCLEDLVEECAANSTYLPTLTSIITPLDTAYNATCGNLPTCSQASITNCETTNGGSMVDILKNLVSNPCQQAQGLNDCLRTAADSCGDNAIGNIVKRAYDAADSAYKARCAASGLVPSILLIVATASLVLNLLRK